MIEKEKEKKSKGVGKGRRAGLSDIGPLTGGMGSGG